MIKKLKFWFDVLKGCLGVYEEATNTHDFNPLSGKKYGSKSNNVQPKSK